MFFGGARCDARHPQLGSFSLLFVIFIQFSGPYMDSKIRGADDGEGTPVPIPNTAVKLTRADNTWLEAAWNDR